MWKHVDDIPFGASPVGPDELAHSSRYVFALPPRYDVADLPGSDEVRKLFNGNPLRAY